MSAVRVKKTKFQQQSEEILERCEAKIRKAYKKYHAELMQTRDSVNDSIELIAYDKPFS